MLQPPKCPPFLSLLVLSMPVPLVNRNKMIFEAGAAQLKQNYTCLKKCCIFSIRINSTSSRFVQGVLHLQKKPCN